jgi:kynurenine aminotransferase
MIIVNTPHNPVGKVFTRAELEKIAALAEEFNLLVMSDEVVRLKLFYYRGQPLSTILPVRLPGL